MRIVFFGTSQFAANVLKNLLGLEYNIVAVVTRPDRPQGRSLQLQAPPVKSFLIENCIDIDIHQPEKASTEAFSQVLSQYNPDLFLVVAYGEIIKDMILKLPKKGCINIHASVLPRYRGAAPIQRSIMDGEKETGITIIEMVAKMDAGAMLACKTVPIQNDDNAEAVEKKLMSLCDKLVPDVLDNYDEFYNKKISQDESKVTFAAKIMPEDLELVWSKDAEDLHNQIRGLSPSPCAFCKIKINNTVKRLKVKKAEVAKDSQLLPGHISIVQDKFLIGCKKGSLSILEVQLEGKKFMTIKDFIAGLGESKKNLVAIDP